MNERLWGRNLPQPRTGTPTPTTPGCPGRRHGTRRAYETYGCRCTEAVAIMRARWRDPGGQPRQVATGRPPKRPVEIAQDRIEVAMTGRYVPLTLKERVIAARRLTAAGLSARAIGRRLGIHSRTVVRYRNGHVASARNLDKAAA